MAITISLLALLATFYQLYLQRVHNAKSLKPLGQITLDDRHHLIAVRLNNYGLGPLIIEHIEFLRNGSSFSSIKDCLDLPPRSYMHASMDDLSERIIPPTASLTIFEKAIEDALDADLLRQQLQSITLQIKSRDIYDNTVTVKRNFRWFARHLSPDDFEQIK